MCENGGANLMNQCLIQSNEGKQLITSNNKNEQIIKLTHSIHV